MEIISVNYSLTTHCNFACPNCCAGITAMPLKNRKFYDWSYVENSAKYFYGIKNVNLTGGEPTIHPKFSEWVPKLKELFGCQTLSVWTNATMFKKKADTFKYFDIIHISHYDGTIEGTRDNTSNIEWIKDYLKGEKVEIRATLVRHQAPTGKTGICHRATINGGGVEFVDGKVYPCCASSALPTQNFVILNENWREEVMKIYPPCHECLFAE